MKTLAKEMAGNLLIIEGTEYKDPTNIANDLCKYFSNVGSTQAAKIQASNKTTKDNMSTIIIGNSIFLTPTDPHEIMETITSFKTKQSTGLDGTN